MLHFNVGKRICWLDNHRHIMIMELQVVTLIVQRLQAHLLIQFIFKALINLPNEKKYYAVLPNYSDILTLIGVYDMAE